MSKQSGTNINRVFEVQNKRKQFPDVKSLIKGIFEGDKTALARAITLIESTKKEHQEIANMIIEKCLTKKTNTVRIGITGVPGVGKSTFIEAFGKKLTSLGKKVAVLAVDPTSTQNKGSILGDKTRMQELVRDSNAFIRPSPSGTSLGGVARKTRETIILCEAAGYDIILVETVGVGQSETVVHSMVDFFLLLLLPGAGDELQGIKRGVVEMADGVVINKAEEERLELAKKAKRSYKNALHLYPMKASGVTPEVVLASALHNEGIETVWKMIAAYETFTKENHYFKERRAKQAKYWLSETIKTGLESSFFKNEKTKPSG